MSDQVRYTVGYAEQEADDVVRLLTVAAQLFANVLGRVSADDWERSVIYDYPPQLPRVRLSGLCAG